MAPPASNLEILKQSAKEHELDHDDLVELTEYSIDSVRSWFCHPSSDRYRPVPDRAISLFRANLKNKNGVRI